MCLKTTPRTAVKRYLGNSQQPPTNLFQKRVATSLFHRNVLLSAHRGRCLRGNDSGAALFRVPPGMREAGAAAASPVDTGVDQPRCSLSLWQVCIMVWRYRRYFEERAVAYRFSVFSLHKYKPCSPGLRGQHCNALQVTLTCKASAQRVSKEQKLPRKQLKAHLIPPWWGLTGGVGRAVASPAFRLILTYSCSVFPAPATLVGRSSWFPLPGSPVPSPCPQSQQRPPRPPGPRQLEHRRNMLMYKLE